MSNQQLYFAIGVPVVVGLVNLTVLIALFVRLDTKIEAVRAELGTKIDALSAKVGSMGERLAALEVRVAHLEQPE